MDALTPYGVRHAEVPLTPADPVRARPGDVGGAAGLGKPDDEAIIYANGTMEGFVGGSWAESRVRAQCLTPPT
jgi:hypothetical protein